MALSNVQKRFIRDKVADLGTRENVMQFYKRKSLVCEYAHKQAAKLPKKKRK